jgi:hypothetical protein
VTATPTILNWWCGLFGYGGCGAVSVFEALILLPVTALALTAAAAAVFGLWEERRSQPCIAVRSMCAWRIQRRSLESLSVDPRRRLLRG